VCEYFRAGWPAGLATREAPVGPVAQRAGASCFGTSRHRERWHARRYPRRHGLKGSDAGLVGGSLGPTLSRGVLLALYRAKLAVEWFLHFSSLSRLKGSLGLDGFALTGGSFLLKVMCELAEVSWFSVD
jgi:hypothetical protein